MHIWEGAGNSCAAYKVRKERTAALDKLHSVVLGDESRDNSTASRQRVYCVNVQKAENWLEDRQKKQRSGKTSGPDQPRPFEAARRARFRDSSGGGQRLALFLVVAIAVK